MAHRWLMKPKWLVFVPLLVILAGVAVACGDDATPVPLPTPAPLDTAAIQSAVLAAVAASAPTGASVAEIKALVETAVNAAKTEGVTQAEVAALVSKAVSDAAATAASPEDIEAMVKSAVAGVPAGPAPISQSDLQKLVQAAVTESAPKGASPAEIKALVDSAVKAAIAPGVTKGDVEALVTKAVADAAAAVPEGVSAEDVKTIVTDALKALPTPMAVMVPTPTPTLPPVQGPFGTLNVGFKELYTFSMHPRLTTGPTAQWYGSTLVEKILKVNEKREYGPQLAREWSSSPDGVLWTFKLQRGVQFHKGWGEMTSEDVVWNMEQFAHADAITAFAPRGRRLWGSEAVEKGGHLKAIDDYTIEIHTGVFQVDFFVNLARLQYPYVVSKKQVDQEGEEKANLNGAATGPFEFVQARGGEFWKFKAVEGHWRKTPYFAELVYWHIPEESTRLANFHTGRLDTFTMNPDTIPAVRSTVGSRFMRLPGAADEHINIFGQFSVGVGTDKQAPAYDPSLPWVSGNADVNSDEWKNAAKVRRAMAMSIDRQLIVDTILAGEGQPEVLHMWVHNRHQLPPDIAAGWPYDVEQAKRLLVEAGYPGGDFDIDVTPSIRGVPGEVAACEAVAEMWGDIGIRAHPKSVPWPVFYPMNRDRTYQGANCHGTSGQVDPLPGTHFALMSTGAIFTWGFNHPYLDAQLGPAIFEPDPEARWEIMRNVARFIFDNALEIGLYSANVIWPLGTRIDEWRDFLDYNDPRTLTEFAYTPHRGN